MRDVDSRLLRLSLLRWPRCRPPRRTPTSIGLTGALTGPPASTYAPAVEALRIYIDRSTQPAASTAGKSIS